MEVIEKNNAVNIETPDTKENEGISLISEKGKTDKKE